MGLEVEREEFGAAEAVAFAARLRDSLDVLAALLERPGFGAGEPTLGAELELSLVDRSCRPLLRNADVLAASDDARLTVEVERFNLECNLPFWPLAGRPFARLEAELDDALAVAREAAATHGGRVVPIGILPTLTRPDLGEGSITDSARFRALNAALLERGDGAFRLSIHGDDDLELETGDVSYEGANTSFQLHLRIEPARFAAVHNAAQLATAPVLAVAGNSPTFLGHRLWEETRVALFKQAVDHRDAAGRRRHDDPRVSFGRGWVRETALELFAESVELHEPLLPVLADEEPRGVLAVGGLPELAELRLHQGTVWRWNRAVYDPADGGHLRVELRALPAGPTVLDMAANAALLVGLTLALARDAAAWSGEHAFEDAHAAFYAAAREGLEAVLPWPGLAAPVPAGELVPRLLPLAHAGLVEEGGVEEGEAARLLAVVEERVRARQTGARWQRRALAALEGRHGRERALAAMLEHYLALSASGEPVHRWPLPPA